MQHRTTILAALAWLAVASVAAADEALLLPSNLQAPFCYVSGGERHWPVLAQALPESTAIELIARSGDEILARGQALELPTLAISLSRAGVLKVSSRDKSTTPALQLEVNLRDDDGKTTTQKLTLRPAPPPRPLSYIADFGDDLIQLFMNGKPGEWRPLTKSAFDQYFRRLQAHGVSRLIMWLSPFPYIADPKNYATEDWQRYAGQTRAIIESAALNELFEQRPGYTSWKWVRGLMALRLTPAFGDLLTQSARDHGIALTASFRPFEQALSKYYHVPTFDHSGEFLWNFHPMASPTVNYHPDRVGFAHYRTLLAEMGQPERGTLDAITIANPVNAAAFMRRYLQHGDNLRIVAAPFPPLQRDSFVLQRGADHEFRLLPYGDIQTQAEARLHEVKGFKVAIETDGSVKISGLKVPPHCHYLLLSNPAQAEEALDLPTLMPVELWARAGNRLGRELVYWVAPEDDPAGAMMRVGGITTKAAHYTDFQASESSGDHFRQGAKRLSLREQQLVIDLGAPWSIEMVDYQQEAAWQNTINELRSILARAPFDEIFINTRSHCQLPAYQGDGADGIQPRADYRAAKTKPFVHLGVDRAYVPRTAAALPELRALVRSNADVEKITSWQAGEWNFATQRANAAHPWPVARNVEISRGIRRLLQDLEAAFPTTRIRVVLPERAAATEKILTALDTMPKPGGGVYGRDYFRHIWASINHIPSIGEGMSLVDLSGLKVEPVFLGIRALPEMEPFKLFVRECIADMADNHGSSFRGPLSFFYEGHETLRMTDAAAGRLGREERIRHLLDQRGEINEVLLYESAAWVGLPLSDPDLSGHGFLDRPAKSATEKTPP